jgi:DNA-binding transcriptional LysR family regulator
MTYYQIETFLTVANLHNLSVAANVLHVTQSTISHRISSLEDELGMILIERQKGHKQTMITTLGEKFVPVAQQWKDLWEETQTIKKKEQQSVLHIVAPNSILLYELKPLLTKICLNEPYLTMFISSNHSVQVRDLLENRTADIGFVSFLLNKNLILKRF